MRRFSRLLGVAVGVLSLALVTTVAVAQEKKAEKAKEDRVSGRIRLISKDTNTITVARGNVQRQVVWDSNTKFTKMNKPGSLDDVKENVRVICLGKFEGVKLMATRIDVRE